jgi:hypothetical protein
MKYPFLFFISFLSIYALSQENDGLNKYKLGYIFSIENSKGYFSELNTLFALKGITPINESLETMKVGFFLSEKDKLDYTSLQFIMLNSLSKDSTSNSSSELKMTGLYFSVRHDLLKKSPPNLLYPLLGFGYSDYQLVLTNKSNNKPNFSQLLDSTSHDKLFKAKPLFYAELGAGYERRFTLFRITGYWGINISYQLNFNKLKWETLAGIPIENMHWIRTDGFKTSFLTRIELDRKFFYKWGKKTEEKNEILQD